MITGHNTDVEYAGRVYHVQTEDKGVENPLIETLVYSKGEILDTRRSSYADLVASGACSEADVARRIEEQHRRCVRDVCNGRYDPDGPRPFGYNIITSRSFDEVVSDTLRSSALSGALEVEILSEPHFFEGASAEVELQARANGGEAPAPSARVRVRVKLLRTSGKALKLFDGRTGPDGRLSLSVTVPRLNGAEGIILIEADADGMVAEVRRPVLRAAIES